MADVAAISAEAKLVEGNWGATRAPAIRVNAFNFTGATKE
jgi:hypothetical protein